MGMSLLSKYNKNTHTTLPWTVTDTLQNFEMLSLGRENSTITEPGFDFELSKKKQLD